MITPEFKEKIERGFGGAVILAGSGSDEAHIDKLAKHLKEYEIPFEVRVASAHKQCNKLRKILEEYDALEGPLVYLAVAGGTDALSGTLSFTSLRPTITCPPDHLNMSGLTNPPGSSNAYIARPENAARFIAQMFSSNNSGYKNKLTDEMEKKRQGLELDDESLRTKYAEDKRTN